MDERYAQSGIASHAGGKRRNPHDKVRVDLTDDQRGRLDQFLAERYNRAVSVLARTVAGSLMARQVEGEVKRLRAVWGAVSEGEDVFTADQVRFMLQGLRLTHINDLYAALMAAWEREEV